MGIWVSRIDATADPPRPERGSPMHADDRRLAPYQLSHACWHSLSHAVDHLNCLRSLLQDAGVVHMYAPYTLVRGALENACASVWLLRPRSRAERVIRRLRFAVNDINHGEEAKALTGRQGPRSKGERIAQIRSIAKQCGVDENKAVKTAGYKEIINAASDGNQLILLAWKLCSGIAHGDFWTTPAAAQMISMAEEPSEVGAFAVSARVGLLMQMTALAVNITSIGWQLYDQRCWSPLPAD